MSIPLQSITNVLSRLWCIAASPSWSGRKPPDTPCCLLSNRLGGYRLARREGCVKPPGCRKIRSARCRASGVRYVSDDARGAEVLRPVTPEARWGESFPGSRQHGQLAWPTERRRDRPPRVVPRAVALGGARRSAREGRGPTPARRLAASSSRGEGGARGGRPAP